MYYGTAWLGGEEYIQSNLKHLETLLQTPLDDAKTTLLHALARYGISQYVTFSTLPGIDQSIKDQDGKTAEALWNEYLEKKASDKELVKEVVELLKGSLRTNGISRKFQNDVVLARTRFFKNNNILIKQVVESPLDDEENTALHILAFLNASDFLNATMFAQNKVNADKYIQNKQGQTPASILKANEEQKNKEEKPQENKGGQFRFSKDGAFGVLVCKRTRHSSK